MFGKYFDTFLETILFLGIAKKKKTTQMASKLLLCVFTLVGFMNSVV